jgi:hypothetical protein
MPSKVSTQIIQTMAKANDALRNLDLRCGHHHLKRLNSRFIFCDDGILFEQPPVHLNNFGPNSRMRRCQRAMIWCCIR